MSMVLIAALYMSVLRTWYEPRGWQVFLLSTMTWYYGYIPYRLRRDQWHSSEGMYEPIELDDPECPEVVRLRAQRAIADLTPLGFVLRGHFRAADHVPVLTAYVSLFESPSNWDTAKLTSITGRRRPVTTLGFMTEATDRTLFSTSDNRQPPVTPRVRIRKGSMALPGLASPQTLYQAHRARVDVPDVAGPTEGDMIAYLRRGALLEHAGWIAAGYYELDPSSRKLRMTWKGAYLIGWKLLWPVGPIRKAWRRLRAWWVLRQLGLA